MADHDWPPEIVIGVDFGMTCTGVAYSTGPEWLDPKTIQHWPGKGINELANKVPTLLQYENDGTTVKSWGFLSETDESSEGILACFKLHLDPTYRDLRPGAPRLAQARQWFQDYLRCVHDHIVETFESSFPRWSLTKTDFVFSVPTTWKNPGMIMQMERLIKSAGYGSDGPFHRARIGLTEAEAAAVYASRQKFDRNDVVLVCDAGGGTTDVNVLKLASSKGQATQLQQLSWVEGRAIGSALIDLELHELITTRLEKIQDQLQEGPAEVADQMIRGRWERTKCSYGTSASSGIPTIPLPVPGLSTDSSFPQINIEGGKMILRREEIKKLFDTQVDSMLDLVDEQYERVEQNHPGVGISYLVLSGGLGSSAYVKQRLESRFGVAGDSLRQSALIVVFEPQLAVVHGLVMDQTQVISRGRTIFNERCCRVSYGVRCRQAYDPNNPRHIGKLVRKDLLDGKRYVENVVDWFVKQVSPLVTRSLGYHLLMPRIAKGEIVPSEGISKPYWLKIRPGEENNPWKTDIVTSSDPGNQLPTSMAEDGVKVVCEVESNLRNKIVDIKVKNRHWYSVGRKYVRAKFCVRVILGAADLKFQLQSNDRHVLSHDHDAIHVTWEDPEQFSNDDCNGIDDMYKGLR